MLFYKLCASFSANTLFYFAPCRSFFFAVCTVHAIPYELNINSRKERKPTLIAHIQNVPYLFL